MAGRATPSEEHLWGARAYYKVPFYTNAPCWFASEMGYHGCPNRASLERMMTPAHVYPWAKVTGKDPKRDYHWNEEWQFKASDAWLNGFGFRRNSLMTNQVKLQFGDVPTDLDDFILASQIVQAEAMKTFVELFRSQKFTRKNGLIWWNVRDGWPQISDAVVDYYGDKKLAYYYIKCSQKPFCLMFDEPHDGSLRLYAVNDTRMDKTFHYTIEDDGGNILAEGTAFAKSDESTLIHTLPATEEKRYYIIRWDDGTEGGMNHYFANIRDIDYDYYRTLLDKLQG